MALDLFANFERYSNSSLFYRVTSSSPLVFSIKLSSLSNPGQNLSLLYTATSSINNSTPSPFNPNYKGEFVTQWQIPNASVTGISSIQVDVYSNAALLSSFTLSASIVQGFPAVNFISYPSFQIEESSGDLISLNSTNYTSSSGVYFYGEGHTEIINLSASGLTSQETAKWYIGNSIDKITTYGSNLSTVKVSLSTSTVSVSSTLSDERIYPISLWATNSSITTAGPFIRYNDNTGIPEFYPFFTSTVDVTGTEQRSNLKGNIQVHTYNSLASPVSLATPFLTSLISLPLDYSSQKFIGIVSTPYELGILDEETFASKWSVETPDDWFVPTIVLSSVLAYQFKLNYDKNYNELHLPAFNASPVNPTTIILSLSAFKKVKYTPYEGPTDWQQNNITLVDSVSTIVGPYPTLQIFTPNYYNIKGQEIPISIIDTLRPPYRFTNIIIKSNISSSTLILSAGALSGIMTFDKKGIVDLTLTTTLTSPEQNGTQQMVNVFSNVFEIVDDYDYVNPDYFQSSLTPLALTYTSYPRLSPNEWAIADNINSIFKKIYTTIDELDQYTKLYVKKDILHGWLGPKQIDLPKDWIDVDCTMQADVANSTWAQAENNNVYVWKNHECSGGICSPDPWHISTIEPSFNIPSTSYITRCPIVDVKIENTNNIFVIAYQTEINLFDTSYNTTYINRIINADDLFSFQNIAGVTISPEGKIIVLDNILARVSIYTVSTSAVNLYASWGSYGTKSNKTGFNLPQDIHLDDKNSIWIADTGNNCVKKFTIIGNPLLTIIHEKLDANAPISVCVDSQFNVHCLTNSGVIVFDQYGNYLFEYTFPEEISGVNKINTSYNREAIYISYSTGVVKYFRTGVICHYVIQDYICTDGNILEGYGSVYQDKFRNTYVAVTDKILKFADLQVIEESKAPLPTDLYWNLQSLLVHKEEYIQPWVYLKSFHRLWDNIELTRNSLFYELSGCKSFTKPTYAKTDLIIGQNELLTNAVINRLSEQLWTNLKSIIDYFDPNC